MSPAVVAWEILAAVGATVAAAAAAEETLQDSFQRTAKELKRTKKNNPARVQLKGTSVAHRRQPEL